VQNRRKPEENLVSEAVHEKAEKQDDDAEADEPHPRDLTQLRLRETEFRSPGLE